jgi:hypothetical protein
MQPLGAIKGHIVTHNMMQTMELHDILLSTNMAACKQNIASNNLKYDCRISSYVINLDKLYNK